MGEYFCFRNRGFKLVFSQHTGICCVLCAFSLNNHSPMRARSGFIFVLGLERRCAWRANFQFSIFSICVLCVGGHERLFWKSCFVTGVIFGTFARLPNAIRTVWFGAPGWFAWQAQPLLQIFDMSGSLSFSVGNPVLSRLRNNQHPRPGYNMFSHLCFFLACAVLGDMKTCAWAIHGSICAVARCSVWYCSFNLLDTSCVSDRPAVARWSFLTLIAHLYKVRLRSLWNSLVKLWHEILSENKLLLLCFLSSANNVSPLNY